MTAVNFQIREQIRKTNVELERHFEASSAAKTASERGFAIAEKLSEKKSTRFGTRTETELEMGMPNFKFMQTNDTMKKIVAETYINFSADEIELVLAKMALACAKTLAGNAIRAERNMPVKIENSVCNEVLDFCENYKF